MVGLSRCNNTPIDLVLTAPDGPMGGDEGDDHYAKVCPACGDRLVLRWSVHIDVLPATTPDAKGGA
jgi:hypothetical protein